MPSAARARLVLGAEAGVVPELIEHLRVAVHDADVVLGAVIRGGGAMLLRDVVGAALGAVGVELHHAVARVDEAAEVLALVGVAGDDHRALVAVRGLLRDDGAGAGVDAVHLSLAKGVPTLDDHD